MKQRNLTIRNLFGITLTVFMFLFVPQSASADAQISTFLSDISSLSISNLSILNSFDFSNQLNSFNSSVKELVNTTADVTGEITQNVDDVKSLASEVISNISRTAGSQIASQSAVVSASVSNSVNGNLEKAYGFLIDKAANVFSLFFNNTEDESEGVMVDNENIIDDISEKKIPNPARALEPVSTQPTTYTITNSQSTSNASKNFSAPQSILSNTFIQNILKRLSTIESTLQNTIASGAIVGTPINPAYPAPIYQYITNNYAGGGGSYSVPADTTASTNAIVTSAVSTSAASLQQQINVLSTSGAATNTFAYILATSTTATSTFSGNIDVGGNLIAGGNITANAFYGDGSNLTGITSFSTSTTRGVLSSSATGLTYNNSTGDFSLTSGYNIPLTASTTEWAGKISSQWTTSGSNISFSSGNVGIGTTNPGAKLEVKGTETYFTDATGVAVIDIRPGTTKNQIYSNYYSGGDIPLILGTLAYRDNQLYLATSGNVGVGTTTPSSALTVTGSILSTGSLSIATSLVRTGQGTFFDGNNFTALGANAGFRSDGGNMTLGNASNAYLFTLRQSYGLFAASTASIGFTDGASYNGTLDTNLSRISAGVIAVGTGSTGSSAGTLLATTIGIGTTTPGSALTVSGNTFIGGTLTATGTVNVATKIIGTAASAPTVDFGADMGNVLMISGGTGGRVVGFGNMGGGHMAVRISSGAFLEWSVPNDPRQGVDTAFQRLAAGKIGLGNGTADDISGTLVLGNLGIGTTTPGYTLTVAGDISLTGALRANGNAGTLGMVLQTTGTGTQWVATSSLGISSSPAGSDTYLQFNDGGVFGADSGLVYDKTTDQLTVGILKTSSANGNLIITPTATSTSYTNLGGSGNRSSFITITTSITSYNSTLDKLVNGNLSDNLFYWSGQTTASKYLRFDFGAGYKPIITEAKWYQGGGSDSQGVWKWQGSNDASSWTDIGSSFTLGGSLTQTQTELSANTTAYRYYQLLGVSGSLSGTPYEQEIEFKLAYATDITTINAVGASGGLAGLSLQTSGHPMTIGGSLNVTGGITMGTTTIVSSQWVPSTSPVGISYPPTGTTAYVGIGKLPETGYYLDVYNTLRVKADVANVPALMYITNSTGNAARFVLDSPTGPSFGVASAFVLSLSNANDGLLIMDNSTEKYRFQRDGRAGFGTSTPLYRLDIASSTASGYVARITNTGNATGANGLIIQGGENTTGGATFVDFRINSGTSVGSITQVSNTGVLYNTTSDLRAKENIVATHYGLSDLMNIKVSDYNFISDAQKRRSTGVIAQELYAIFPEAVSKPADESKSMWAVDYGRITPLIIKSVQELSNIVTTLKIKVEAMFAWFGTDGDRFNVKGLVCVDDVCVTKDQFKQFLINTGGTSGVSTSTPVVTTPVAPTSTSGVSGNSGDSENTQNGTSTTSGDTNGGGTNGDASNSGVTGGTDTTTTSIPDETQPLNEPISNPQPESVPAQTPAPVTAPEPTPVVAESAPTPEPAPSPNSPVDTE